MNEYIKSNLENGEKVIWSGGSAAGKVWDNTYRIPYLLRFLISYGLAAALLIYAFQKTGELRISVILVIAVIGSMIPLTAIANGVKAHTIGYAATDRRLIKVNGSMAYTVDYDEIGECSLRKDPSGNTSLLCGSKAIKSRPSKWRNLALFTGTQEKDTSNHVTDYVFYAVDDPDGLRNALNGKVNCTD